MDHGQRIKNRQFLTTVQKTWWLLLRCSMLCFLKPWTELRLNQAQLRGRYMKAVGMMQYTGIPIDKGLLEDLNANWDQIKTELIDSINVTFGTYTNGSFREALFEDYLAREGIAWPRLPSGRLALDKNTFSSMSKRNSSVRPLHELRKTLGEFKLNKLAVGSDSRNRTLLITIFGKDRSEPAKHNKVLPLAQQSGSWPDQARAWVCACLLRLVLSRNCYCCSFVWR